MYFESFIIIAIISLIAYILLKLSDVLYKAVDAFQHKRNFQQDRPEGSIHVDSAPKKERRGQIKGGEYIDYEEVK